MVTAGCWLWYPAVACSGGLLGGFESGAGGTSGVHMSQGEWVAGEGWGWGLASEMVAVGERRVVGW